jgi:hypothetical protein
MSKMKNCLIETRGLTRRFGQQLAVNNMNLSVPAAGVSFFALFAASASVGKYYPWLLPMNIFIEGRFTAALLLGIGGGIVASLLGCFAFVRRDVA